MEKISRLILICLIGLASVVSMTYSTLALAEKLPLGWQAPTQNCDGTPLTTSGLSAYNVYFTLGSGRPDTTSGCTAGCRSYQYEFVSTITDVSLTSAIITVDSPGEYYVAMTAVDLDGDESCYSNEVIKTVNSATPDSPLNFEISFSDFRKKEKPLL